MLIYYFLMLAAIVPGVCFCGREGRRSSTIFYLAAMGLLLTAVASFRYAIGFDYYSYRSIYLETAGRSAAEIIRAEKSESLFYLLNKAVSACGFSFTGFLTIVNLFLHGTAMWFISRYSKIPWLSVYLYVALQFLAYNMNLIRQSIAAAFFLLAFPHLVRRRFLPFLALMTAGGLIHNSLFLIIPFYFLLPLKSTKRNMTVISVLAAALYLIIPELEGILAAVLPERYSGYAGSLYWQGNSFRYAVLPAVYFLIVFRFRRRFSENNAAHTAYQNSALYTALISLFITRHFILERFSIYPFILSIAALPEIACPPEKVKKAEASGKADRASGEPEEAEEPEAAHKKRAFPALALVLLYGLCYFSFAAWEGFHHVYPYVSLLDRAYSTAMP